MTYLSTFIVLIASCISVNGLCLTPCRLHDLICFKRMFKSYINQTYKGIKEYDIKPIDPLIIPSLDIEFQNADQSVIHFKNITVKGLQDQMLVDFELYVDKKSLFLTYEKVEVSGGLTMVFRKKSKTFTGTFSMKGSTLVNSTSNYYFTTDCYGIDHIRYGPEILTCNTIGFLKVTLSPEILTALLEDKKLYEDNIRAVYCTIVNRAWATVMYNVRVGVEILPKSEILIGDIYK